MGFITFRYFALSRSGKSDKFATLVCFISIFFLCSSVCLIFAVEQIIQCAMCLILFIVYLSSFICIYTITDIMLYEKKTWKVINSISYVCNFIYARLFFFGVCLLPFVCNVFNVLAVAAAALVLLSVHIHLLLCFIQLIYRANEFMKNEFTLMSSESKWTVVALYLSTLFFFHLLNSAYSISLRFSDNFLYSRVFLSARRYVSELCV